MIKNHNVFYFLLLKAMIPKAVEANANKDMEDRIVNAFLYIYLDDFEKYT